jgi:hypothetical protein
MTDALWSMGRIALACILSTIILLEILNRGRLTRAICRYTVARVRRHITECRIRMRR